MGWLGTCLADEALTASPISEFLAAGASSAAVTAPRLLGDLPEQSRPDRAPEASAVPRPAPDGVRLSQTAELGQQQDYKEPYRDPHKDPLAADTKAAGATAAIAEYESIQPAVYRTERPTMEPLPAPAGDIWTRIRSGFQMTDLDGPNVRKHEQWYANRPDYLKRMVDRSRRYLYYIVGEVERRGMPLEVALLPMVESAFNPVAYSRAHAAGLWQFIPSTGKQYGMEQNWWQDERRDILAATTGALDYLANLYQMFGDWQLALAAYNWGEGAVSRSVARNQRKGLPTNYTSLRMPFETQHYLPKLQAIKNIIANPAAFGVDLAPIPNSPYFTAVTIAKPIDVKRAAQLADMPLDEFVALNPAYQRPVIAGSEQFTLLVPAEKAYLFAEKVDELDGNAVSWQAYRVQRGDRLDMLAQKFGTTLAALRAANGLSDRHRVPVGHTVLVPATGTADPAATLATAEFSPAPLAAPQFHRARRGETLAVIAQRYGVSADDLQRWNKLRGNRLAAGQKIRIDSGDAAAVVASRPVPAGRAGGLVQVAHVRSIGESRPSERHATNAPAALARHGRSRTVAVSARGGRAGTVAATRISHKVVAKTAVKTSARSSAKSQHVVKVARRGKHS